MIGHPLQFLLHPLSPQLDLWEYQCDNSSGGGTLSTRDMVLSASSREASGLARELDR